MSNLALVTDNMLPVANETFIDNLSAGISAGAAIVPINSLSEYSDGDSVVLTVDPGTASQATFIGEKQGNTVIDCKWTEGNVGASHAAGATVIDYDSATHYNVVTKLLRMLANENGSLKTTAVQAALNISSAVPADWTPLATAGSLQSSLGNYEYKLLFPGVNYTDRLGAGTKLRIPRTGTIPTQIADFEASLSQYASKASPTNLAPTTAWTYETILQGESNVQGYLVGRRNGTGGWNVEILANGKVSVYYSDGTNITSVQSVPSIPLDRQIRLSCTVNVTTKAIVIYFNGLPVQTTTSSNAATTMTNGTTFYLGTYNGSSFFYDGTQSDVRLWNTIRTPAEVLNNAYKTLAGNESGLIGYWKLDGNFNDSHASANHLTASGGASATVTGHLYKSVEYAWITKAEVVGSDTVATIFTGNRHSLPNDTLGAISFSNLDTPFGFPADEGAWELEFCFYGAAGENPADALWKWSTVGAMEIKVPTGRFELSYDGVAGGYTAAQSIDVYTSLSKSTSTDDDPRFTLWINSEVSGVSVRALRQQVTRELPVNNAAQTPYYLIMKSAASNDDLRFHSDITPTILKARISFT